MKTTGSFAADLIGLVFYAWLLMGPLVVTDAVLGFVIWRRQRRIKRLIRRRR
jgi:hypothetical protein